MSCATLRGGLAWRSCVEVLRRGLAWTLKWSKVPEDSSDFDDFWTELIVMTWTFILATLRFFRDFFFHALEPGLGVRGEGVGQIQIQRKSKRKRKQKRKRGNLRGGREAPPRRLLHPLRFCFRFSFWFTLNLNFKTQSWEKKTRYWPEPSSVLVRKNTLPNRQFEFLGFSEQGEVKVYGKVDYFWNT